MDNNFINVKDAKQLDQLLEKITDKLVVIMFYTKDNPTCRTTLGHFERLASNHTISYFIAVDMNNLQGDSRYAKNIQSMPKIDYYYMNNMIHSHITTSDKEIEFAIQNAERQILTSNNMKNNNMGMNTMGMNTMGMNNISPMQLAQMKQQILNNLKVSNPDQAMYLIQNQQMLHNMAYNQLLQQQMAPAPNMMTQQQLMPNMPNMMTTQSIPNMMTTQQSMPNMMAPQSIPNMMTAQQSMPNMMAAFATQSMPIPPNSTDTATNLTPTFQQMQQMFQIWQMMQQMGILNTQQPKTSQNNLPSETIILPNGDKLVPLANGEYALIKNKNNS